MSDEAKTFTMKLAGRDIEFRRSNLGQIIMLQRTAYRAIQRAQEETDETARVTGASKGMVKVLDFVDSLVVKDEDREFIEAQMLAGTIEWEDLMRVLSGGKDDVVADDEAPAKPVKRAPRKSPKAAPATGVANRGRTKR